jgi:hypothetical protein
MRTSCASPLESQTGADLGEREALDADALAAPVLAGDERDCAPGDIELAGQQLQQGVVRRALDGRSADPDLERSLAHGSESRTRGAGLCPDCELDSAGDLPEGVCYGVPAFFGARNDTLSSTRTGASVSGEVTTSSNFRCPETSDRTSASKRAR